jgi:hypothetical protein
MKMSSSEFESLKRDWFAKAQELGDRNGFAPVGLRGAWDVLHAMPGRLTRLYDQNLNDDHIETALRKILAS